ncbi:hypothetical protein PG996_007524 [Apiospora saccharicola]|uniref:Uncharacterized protein n=1 Tax=Apiospora saccharicola TaxID=335842 RepID=A0ABR1VB22_9PEZI
MLSIRRSTPDSEALASSDDEDGPFTWPQRCEPNYYKDGRHYPASFPSNRVVSLFGRAAVDIADPEYRVSDRQRFHHWRRDGIEENSWRLDQQPQRPRPEVFSWLRALQSHYGKEHVRTSAHARDTEKDADRPYWRPLPSFLHGSCHAPRHQLDVANRR